MLYYLIDHIDRLYHIPGSGLIRYITFRAAAAAVSALVIAFWLGPRIIRRLKEHQIGEAAKIEAPKTHLAKAGTPTMGGLIVLASVIVPTLLWANVGNVYIHADTVRHCDARGGRIPGRLPESGQEKAQGADRAVQDRRAGVRRHRGGKRHLLFSAMDRCRPVEIQHVNDGAVLQEPGRSTSAVCTYRWSYSSSWPLRTR
jgi:hypothetical protein